MIYILTGKIRTGKTTALLNWCESRSDVHGLLCPDDHNGKRYFLNVKSKDTFPLEVLTDSEVDDIIPIGPFKFLKSSFERANDYLESLMSLQGNTFVIIDELGKLELKNEGLHASAEILVAKFMSNDNQHLILVVRDYLIDDILMHYTISEYSVLKKEDLRLLR